MRNQRRRVSARRTVAALAAVILLLALPAARATHDTEAGNGIDEAGFHGLDNQGFNTDIMPWVSAAGGVFAATGTWGSVLAPGNDCPSETDDPGDPQASGIKIIEATDPTAPQLVARLATIPGSQNNDVKVAHVPTTEGARDLLVHSLEPCGVEGLLHQVPGSPVIDVATLFQQATGLDHTGFQIYDVSDPSNPAALGVWNNGGIGTHNLFVFTQGDRTFVAAVFNQVDQLGLEAAENDFVVGILQIVEITDASNPTLVSEWRLADAEDQGGPSLNELCTPRGTDSQNCVLHDVWVSDDGATAYLSFWDAGLVLLDLSDPTEPTFIGQAQGQVQDDDPEGWLNEEGNTHVAVPMVVDGRQLVIVGDEDFTGGAQVGVTVNTETPEPNVAGFVEAAHWDGTAPLDDQTADFVYAGTGCTPLHYAGVDAQGKIALVDKFTDNLGVTDCPTFVVKQKMDAAEAAGAIGLVQIADVDDEGPEGRNAISSNIPGLEIGHDDGVAIRDHVVNDVAVNATLGRGAQIDPWGFIRVVDVTDPDPAAWREVAQFKAPHVEDPDHADDDVFSAHNPIVGPDGRIYVAWYTDGVRVLELSEGGHVIEEIASFAPRPDDHPDDNDSDPHEVQAANIGFWGSWPLCHPDTGELLLFNSDLNRGIYVLRALYDDCREPPDLTLTDDNIAFANVEAGSIEVIATVHNVGTGDAFDVEVLFVHEDEVLGRTTIDSIPAGDRATTSVVWDTSRLRGKHIAVVTVDPANTIEETDETNNRARRLLDLGRRVSRWYR